MYLYSCVSLISLHKLIPLLTLVIIFNIKYASSNAEIKGIAYLDNEKPYKSYVGKILPGKGGDLEPVNNDETISAIMARYSKQASKGKGMTKPKKKVQKSGKKSVTDPKTQGPSSKSKTNKVGKSLNQSKTTPSKTKAKSKKEKHPSGGRGMTKPKGTAHHGKTTKKSKSHPSGKSVKLEKSNWYFKDPQKLLGRSISNYEPSDPTEPRPSEKINEEETKPEEEEVKGSDNNEDEVKNTSPAPTENQDDDAAETASPTENPTANKEKDDAVEPERGSEDNKKPVNKKKKKSKSSKITDDPNRKKPTVIEFKQSDAMNPNMPGWFALKNTIQFGKPLKLGTLLRRRGKDNATEFLSDYVDDAEDGENDDAADKMSSALRKYDKACLWQEYQATKSSLVGPPISEANREKVRWQNHQLSIFFLDIVFNSGIDDFGNSSKLVDQKPSNSFKLLHLTKDIFSQFICTERDKEGQEEGGDATKPTSSKDRILPRAFTETVFHLFLKLYEITKNKEATEYLSDGEFAWIKSNLEACNQTGGLPKKIKWYTDECRETVIAFDQENNYACTPYIEYDFNIKKYDPLLDFIWHMVASVHSHCFESFQTNIRIWHRYSLAMADLITVRNESEMVFIFRGQYETVQQIFRSKF
ncbi:uncharacterized protein LOC118435083 [Folsomia candida]|uniref:uncharacterized protein LOC118435083 n=1 Tax=Folsomia candida TaxID=158441 RepID=UPI001604FBB0|nr:uncharacterized protein LOC118435083 [Folsomia candida]